MLLICTGCFQGSQTNPLPLEIDPLVRKICFSQPLSSPQKYFYREMRGIKCMVPFSAWVSNNPCPSLEGALGICKMMYISNSSVWWENLTNCCYSELSNYGQNSCVCTWERNFSLFLVSDSASLSHPNASDVQQKTRNVNTSILISINEDLNT